MEAALGWQELEEELKSHPPADQILHVNLEGRDPDDGATQIPYEKGALFLRQIENAFGRETFDSYLRAYFDHFAFQSITTAQSLEYLQTRLLALDQQAAHRIPVNDWIYQPGLPASAQAPLSGAFQSVDLKRADWLRGKDIDTTQWSTQEWLHFLRGLPENLGAPRMRHADSSWHLTESGNDEILDQWLLMSIRNHYAPANQRLEEFLLTVGRRKYVKPLYEALLRQGDAKRAAAIYENARPLYHPITQSTIDALLAAKP